MKPFVKVIIITLTVTCFASNATAQKASQTKYTPARQHEIFVGYGIFPAADWLRPNSYVNEKFLHISSFGFGGVRRNDTAERGLRSTGSYFIGYKHRTKTVASIGATYSYSGHSVDEYRIYKGKLGEKLRSVEREYHTLAVELDVRYLTREAVNIYSTVGAGISYENDLTTPEGSGAKAVSKHRYATNFHVSLIGIKAGNERLGGFVELGLGYKGLVSAGAYVRF